MIILSPKIYNNFRREALELRTSEIFGMSSELFEKSLDMIGSSRKYPKKSQDIYLTPLTQNKLCKTTLTWKIIYHLVHVRLTKVFFTVSTAIHYTSSLITILH